MVIHHVVTGIGAPSPVVEYEAYYHDTELAWVFVSDDLVVGADDLAENILTAAGLRPTWRKVVRFEDGEVITDVEGFLGKVQRRPGVIGPDHIGPDRF